MSQLNPEIALYGDYLRQTLAAMHASVAGLSDADINRAPDFPGANSPYVIITHVLGNMRAWVIGIACGADLSRDRPAEFRSRGTAADLEESARALSAEIDAALATLDSAALSDRFTPPQELFGEGNVREISRREALLHPIEHATMHLGHIQVSIDLLKAGK